MRRAGMVQGRAERIGDRALADARLLREHLGHALARDGDEKMVDRPAPDPGFFEPRRDGGIYDPGKAPVPHPARFPVIAVRLHRLAELITQLHRPAVAPPPTP